MNKFKYIFFSLFLLFAPHSLGQSYSTSLQKLEKKAEFHLLTAEKLMLSDADSSLIHGLKAYKYLKELKSPELKVKILQLLGDGYRFTDDLPNALKYYLQAKTMVDAAVIDNPNAVELNLLKVDVRIKMGTLYLQLKNFKKSIHYQEEALAIVEKADERTPEKERIIRKLKIYNNMAAVFISQSDYETALVYFRNALELNKSVNDSNYESSILNNIGICHMELKELDLASHYFQKSLGIRKQTNDEPGQAQVLNNLGKNEVFRKNMNQALEYFNQSFLISKKTGNNASMLVSLESLSTLNDNLGNYRQALIYHKEFKALNDKIFNLESKTAIASLEATHQREQDKKAYELKLKQSEADKLQNIVLAVVLFLVLVVAVFIIFVMRSRIRTARLQQEKLSLESENLYLAQQTLEENLEFKERELTAKALYMLKNDELMTRVTENLNKVKRSLNKENHLLIEQVITDLKLSQRNNAWEEFETHFTKVHSQFYQSLQQKFPTLTPNEKKLCAFLRLNMSTKDISAITNQTVNSITVARTRLRKKLGIDGEDVHMINFLMSL